jgi:hypothetical protein
MGWTDVTGNNAETDIHLVRYGSNGDYDVVVVNTTLGHEATTLSNVVCIFDKREAVCFYNDVKCDRLLKRAT